MKNHNRFHFLLSLLIVVFCILVCQDAMAGTLKLPNALTNIEAEAFYGDSSLDEVIVPEGIKTIGSKAFASSSLRQINLPDSLTFIANDAFDGPEKVHITVNNGFYAYNWAVSNGYILPAPVQKALVGGSKQITVSWNAVENASCYVVYYGT